VNVRSGPGTKYQKIGTAKKGAVYTVSGKFGAFYEIAYGSRTGYIHEHYLSATLASPLPSPKPDETTGDTSSKIVAGYYASWAAYYGYTPDQIPAGVTHVLYAFANIGTDLKIKIGDTEVDFENFQKLAQLKAERPELKTLISIGGWTWSGKFSDAALTDASRTAFADSAVAFIKQYGFDGIDIDWEFPVGGGMSGNTERPEDRENFTLLMAKLREKLDVQGALDQKQYLLSFAGGAQTFYTNIELDKLGAYVDFATIMAYDMHGPSTSSVTDLNAPLYTPTESSPQYQWSGDAAVKLWTDRGFPKHKILLGIPFYGMKLGGVTNENNGLYQSFSSGGSIPYDAIAAAYLTDPAYSRYTHPDARVPWLFNGSTFISYDDPTSIAEKAAYITDAGLGGAAVWELSQNADGTLIGVIGGKLK
jgi:chitinase